MLPCHAWKLFGTHERGLVEVKGSRVLRYEWRAAEGSTVPDVIALVLHDQ